MPFSISAAATRGCRKYMEDRVVVECSSSEDGRLADLFVAVLDGHGGTQASTYVQQILWKTLQKSADFHSKDDSVVLNAMRQAFLGIHDRMKEEHVRWPTRANGYASTAGTTVSAALIRGRKIYTAHCGDSRIVLVGESAVNRHSFSHTDLTADHKPEDPKELARIERAGGAVSHLHPVPRVMWIRCLPDRTEAVPFLSIARSLGDYWSYVPSTLRYAVSPDPDVEVRDIGDKDRYLVLMTDGITHVMRSAQLASHLWDIHPGVRNNRIRNPARYLLQHAVSSWRSLKSDNMTIVCVGLHNDERTPFHALPAVDDVEEEDLSTVFSLLPKALVLLDEDRAAEGKPFLAKTVLPEYDTLRVQRRQSDEHRDEFRGPGFVDGHAHDLADEEEEEEAEEGDDVEEEEAERVEEHSADFAADDDDDEHIHQRLAGKPMDDTVFGGDEEPEEDAEDGPPQIDAFDEEIIRTLESAAPNSATQPVRILRLREEQRSYVVAGSANGRVFEKVISASCTTSTTTTMTASTSNGHADSASSSSACADEPSASVSASGSRGQGDAPLRSIDQTKLVDDKSGESEEEDDSEASEALRAQLEQQSKPKDEQQPATNCPPSKPTNNKKLARPSAARKRPNAAQLHSTDPDAKVRRFS